MTQSGGSHRDVLSGNDIGMDTDNQIPLMNCLYKDYDEQINQYKSELSQMNASLLDKLQSDQNYKSTSHYRILQLKIQTHIDIIDNLTNDTTKITCSCSAHKASLKRDRSRSRSKEKSENKKTPIDSSVNINHGFIYPKKFIKPATFQPASSNISLQNQFSALDVETPEEKAPPPFMIQTLPNFNSVLKRINTVAPITSKNSGEYIKVFTKNADDYRKVRKFLEENDIKAYIITPSNPKRSFKVVLKGMPPNADPEEIKQELTEQGYPIVKITQLVNRMSRQLLGTFIIELERNDTNEEIYKLDKCLFLSVVFEKYEPKKKVIQCFKCNRFNHTARNCLMSPRCLKCAGEHETRSCQLPRSNTPKCINCNEVGHTAAYTQCPKFPKTQEQRDAERIQRIQAESAAVGMSTANATGFPQQQTSSEGFPAQRRSYHNQTRTYAAAATIPSLPPVNIPDDINQLLSNLQPVMELIKELTAIFNGLGNIQELLTTMKAANNPIDKLQAFVNYTASTNSSLPLINNVPK